MAEAGDMNERADEDIETRRKRLLYRSIRTGMKETDILLGNFAKRHLPTFSERQLDLYERILEAGDPVIFAWLCGQEAVPPSYDNDVMKLLTTFKIDQETR